MSKAPQVELPLTLLRLPEVIERTGLSVSEIYRRIALLSFPAPVKLGARASAWPSTEVDRWIQERIEMRDQERATLRPIDRATGRAEPLVPVVAVRE